MKRTPPRRASGLSDVRLLLTTLALLLCLAAPGLAQGEGKRPREKAPPWVVLAITCVIGGAVFLLRQHMIRREEGSGPSARHEDPADVDETVHSLRDELRRGDWRRTQERLEATTDWPERGFLVGALPGAVARETLDRWVEAAPRCAVARLLRANHTLGAAQEARGTGRASAVAADAMEAFELLCAQADEDLVAAAELDPADPTPLALRLVTAIGMGVDEDEQEARFRAAVARDASNLTAHVQRLTLLCRKWGGSDAQMFAFARQASATAPEGSPVHALVPLAHVERWLSATQLQDLEEQPLEAVDEYFRRDDVRREVLAAHARSVASPAWREQRGHFARNVFAFVFWLAEDAERSRAELDTIGARWTEYPWAYAGSAARVVARARQAAGLSPSP